MKKILYLAITILIISTLSACSPAEEKKPESSEPQITAQTTPEPTKEPVQVQIATVTGDGVNIRAEANTDSEIFETATTGEVFLLVKENAEEGWNKIKYDNKDAYISSEFTKVETVTEEQANQKIAGTESSSSEADKQTESSANPESSVSSSSEDSSQSESTPEPTASPEVKAEDVRGNEDGEKR